MASTDSRRRAAVDILAHVEGGRSKGKVVIAMG
jgi:hypothetical protein